MKIYKIRYPQYTPCIAATPDPDRFFAETMSKLKDFPSGSVVGPFQLTNPSIKIQGFFNLSLNVLVFNKATMLSPLGEALAFAGKLHRGKLNDTGEDLFLLDVTAYYNCLDRSRTHFFTKRGGTELGVDHGKGIKSPAFFRN